MNLSDVFGTIASSYQSYNESKAEASRAEQAQLNYQASLNNVSTTKSSLVKIGIIGGVLVVIAYFIFKK